MAKQNIEDILARVRAVEANDADAGLTIRRVIEKAEDNWRLANPDTGESLERKTLDDQDLTRAAEEKGLAGNVNVLTFIKLIAAMPAPPIVEPSKDDIKAAADKEAAEQAEAEAAKELMSKSFADVG